ncbi:hypothetical protein ABPG74_011860 [Tetrahymena malaccensis]
MSNVTNSQTDHQDMQIYCQTHKDKIIFLSYRQQNQQTQIEIECQTCRASKQKQTDWFYVVLSQLLQNNQNQIIYGFPPLKDDEFLKSYYEKLNCNQQMQLQSLEQIKQRFQAIKQEIIQKLENIERDFFQQYDDQIAKYKAYQDEIYKLQQREDLIKLISRNLNVDREILDFFNNQFENLENKESTLKNKISEYQKLVDYSQDMNHLNSKIEQLDKLSKNLQSFLENKEDQIEFNYEINRSDMNKGNLKVEEKQIQQQKNAEELNQSKDQSIQIALKEERQTSEIQNLPADLEQTHQHQNSQIREMTKNQQENQFEPKDDQDIVQQITYKEDVSDKQQNHGENQIKLQDQNFHDQNNQVENRESYNNDEISEMHSQQGMLYSVLQAEDDEEQEGEDEQREDSQDENKNNQELQYNENNQEGLYYQENENFNQNNFQIIQGEIQYGETNNLKQQIEEFINQCNEYLQQIIENCSYKWETLVIFIIFQPRINVYLVFVDLNNQQKEEIIGNVIQK